MRALSGTHMRSLEGAAIQKKLVSSYELMKKAGAALAREAVSFLPYASTFTVLAGKGNNAGDGFVAASCLHRQGFRVRIVCNSPTNPFSKDALTAWNDLPDTIEKITKLTPGLLKDTIVIDAMFGTGFRNSLREPYRHWIHLVNLVRPPVIAADLPSGLDADSGEIPGETAIHADLTVTFGFPKTGLILGKGSQFCGRVLVADIGLPTEGFDDIKSFIPCFGMPDAGRFLHPLPFDTYKQKRGHVAVIGGSRAYPSAPFLSAEAALRAGAGLVTVFIPQSMEVVSPPPKAIIVQRLPDDGHGFFSSVSAEAFQLSPKFDSVAAGMGMSTEEEATPFLRNLMRKVQCPLVLDADALNLIALHPDLLHELGTTTVVTPHEGEMKRMESSLGLSSLPTRLKRAESLSAFTGLHVVMKGPRTLSMSPNGAYAVNLSGSPSLATAGSGDLLSGILAASLLEKDSVLDRICYGVFLHGLLGELASPLTVCGKIADDLLPLIPYAAESIRMGSLKKITSSPL